MNICYNRKITPYMSSGVNRETGNWLEKAANCGLVSPTGAASAVSVVALAATDSISLPLAASAFLCVYSSYLIDYLEDVGKLDASLTSERTRALGRASCFKPLGFAAFLSALVLSFVYGGLAAALMQLSFPLAVALYGTPLFGRLTGGLLGYRRIKDIPGFKSFYTAFFWGLLMLYAAVFVGADQMSLMAFFWVYMVLSDFINTVFCDYKDLARDRAEGVATLVLMLGLAQTTRWLRRLNVVALVLLIAAVTAAIIPGWMIVLAPVHGSVEWVVSRGHALTRMNGNPGDALIDAEFSLWLPLALLGLQAGL